MILSFIGMSGSGKSHWSRRLDQAGFVRFGCDDLIEQRLSEELKQHGYAGIKDVAKWMGQPFDEQYLRTSRRYLELEKEVMDKILTSLSQNVPQKAVVDTTGSVIYMTKEILERLARQTRIVYLETPPAVQQKMYERYLNSPKPVIWGDNFSQQPGESEQEALKRCYPLLLQSRAALYQKYAHTILPYDLTHRKNFTVEEFLRETTH